MAQAWWWSLLCYSATLALSKSSICLLYLSIFKLEWARKACYAVLGIVIVPGTWAVIATLTYTIPLAATWDITVIATYRTSQVVWWTLTGYVPY